MYKKDKLRFEVYDGDELDELCEKEYKEKLQDFEWRGVVGKYSPYINIQAKKCP